MIRKKSISIRSKKTTYDILIGRNLLKENNNYLKLTLADKKIAIISDKTVHSLQYSNFLVKKGYQSDWRNRMVEKF